MKLLNNHHLKAFSLIELSIVLIIIGLLIAGITGGASLIESARRTALINEMNSYKQAVSTFVAHTGRYPGDLNNVGKFGYTSGNIYTASSFGAPYDGVTYYIPLEITAPFIDLYLSKILDFQPKNTAPCVYNTCASLKGVPYSKVYKDFSSYYEYLPSTKKHYITYWNSKDFVKLIKKVDEKVDDGIKKTGKLIGIGHYPTYEEIIFHGASCWGFYYFVGN